MPGIPAFLRGRDVTAFTLTPQAVAADGTLTASTAVSFAGVWDSCQVSTNPVIEEIFAADAVRVHRHILHDDWGFDCVALILRAGTGVNKLSTSLATADYFLLTLTRGTQTWTGYVIRGPHREEIGHGKSTIHASFLAIDAGSNIGIA